MAIRFTSNIFTVFLITAFSLIPFFGYSQGCSDAGVCTVHSIQMHSEDSTFKSIKNKVKIAASFGLAQHGVAVLSPTFEYSRMWNPEFSSAVKITSAIKSGEYTSVYDLSDAIITSDYRIAPKFKVLAGIKVPFNKADKSFNNTALPMGYQTSLGTIDALVGLTYYRNSMSFSLAYQHPLTDNENGFLNADSPDELQVFLSTNEYKRAGDIVLRINNKSEFKKGKIKLIYGILPIYHIINDSYINKTGETTEHSKSQGLTLNVNAMMQYSLSDLSLFEFSAGAPVKARKVRPDGLPQFDLTASYVVMF